MSQEATPVSQTEEAVPAAEPETVSAPLRVFDRLFEIVQFVCLSVISLAAVVGFGFEMWRIVTSDGVALGDLLMLFLYTEVIVMARAALHSDHELAILMPIAMAVVALGRYMVVSSDHNPVHQIMYAGAIFILVAALFLWKFRSRTDESGKAKKNATNLL